MIISYNVPNNGTVIGDTQVIQSNCAIQTLSDYQSVLDAKFGKGVIVAKAYKGMAVPVKHYLPKYGKTGVATPVRLKHYISKYPETIIGINPRYHLAPLSEYQDRLDAKYGKGEIIAHGYKGVNEDVLHTVSGRAVKVKASPFKMLHQQQPNKVVLTGSRKKFTEDDPNFQQLVLERSEGKVECLHGYLGANKEHKLRCTRCESTWIVTRSPLSCNKGKSFSGYCPRCDAIRRYSKVATSWLAFLARRYRVRIHHAGTRKGEQRIKFPNGTWIWADGLSNKYKIVFEFYGDVYHGNPNTTLPRSKSHPFDRGATNRCLYLATIRRERELRKLGYTVIKIWQSEYLDTVKFKSWLNKTDSTMRNVLWDKELNLS